MLHSHLKARTRLPIIAILLSLMIGPHPQKAIAQYYDEIDMIEDSQSTLEGWHAYQPVFNGLKYRSGPWEKRITSEYGGRFFDKEMVTTSLSLVLSTDYDQLKKDFASDTDIAQLCRTKGSALSDLSSARIRLIGLCALDKCERYSDKDWSGIAHSLKNTARHHDMRDKETRMAAADATFIARVASRCGHQEHRDSLLQLSEPLVASALSIYDRCEDVKCDVKDTNFAYSVMPVASSILIALIDIPDIESELIRKTQAYWQYRNYDISEIKDQRIDKSIAELCEWANYSAESCRTRFKYNFFLERHFLDRMSNLTSDANIEAEIAIFKKEFAEEINIRNSGSESSPH